MIFLGKQFDSVNMSISIPADKLTEIKQIIEKLLLKKKNVTWTVFYWNMFDVCLFDGA
jgi:hypothetical protein